MYCKNKPESYVENIWNKDKNSRNEDRYTKKDKHYNKIGKYYLDTLDRGGLGYVESLDFGIQAPNGHFIFPNDRSEKLDDGWRWKWGKEKVEWGLKNDFFEFVKDDKKIAGYSIKLKTYQFVDNEDNIRESIGRAYLNIIRNTINQIGTNEIKKLFNDIAIFSNPKPVGLLKYLLHTLRNDDSIILDFFSGFRFIIVIEVNNNSEYWVSEFLHKIKRSYFI